MESLSIWSGNNKLAWLNSKTLNRRRVLLKYETERPIYQKNPDTFYVIGVDVARYKANTAITVLKIIPGKNYFIKNAIYLEVLHGENYIEVQAPRIKKLIQLFQPREVVIDGNGPGIGLLDAMAIPSVDAKTGEHFPAYYVFNNEYHLPPEKSSPSEKPWPSLNGIIYDIKAGSGNEDEINSYFVSQINNGSLRLLADEKIVRDKLLKTRKGQKMSVYDRREFLLPYEMTSRLVDELNNLKLKTTGNKNEFKIERISKSIEKDRFSSISYGLYRVKYYEEKSQRKKTYNDYSQFAFFTSKKSKKGG